jgi:hypothetical protein
MASAPPAERWLLIESHTPWPRDALTTLYRPAHPAPHPPTPAEESVAPQTSPAGARAKAASPQLPSGDGTRVEPDAQQALPALGESLALEVLRLCGAAHVRPVLIRRPGRVDRTAPRRWALVDSRPGQETIRWGELPTDEHLLNVLAGIDPGKPSTEPIYLVCTHGRHDACCSIRGRPAAAALAAVHPDRTWECSHIGGDRFAANLVFLPHSLFYGHVPESRAVELARQYDEGLVVPDLFRGSGAFSPPVQAAQHFAREAGLSRAVDALRPIEVRELTRDHWQVRLAADGQVVTVEVQAELTTINGSMTCASRPPGRVRQFNLAAEIHTT